MYQQVFRYASTVFVFWWAVLGAWGLVRGNVKLGDALPASISVLVLCGIGCVAGTAMVVVWIVVDRRTRQELLQSQSLRGLVSTIGPVPLTALEPKRSDKLPDFSRIPDVPTEFYPAWLEKYSVSHPKQAALLKAMLQVYEAHKGLPATHVPGGHGGRTLLQHSLLVGYQMADLSMRWSYTGLRDRTGKRVLLKLRDDNYEFDPGDPLVVMVGLAHDIGKIEAFIKNDKGEVIGSHHEHDLTGARMLARIPEMWEIPDEDRNAILLATAHYHHPMELPLSPDRRAIDDRTIALMELLIKADFRTGAIESKGSVPSEADYEREMDAREQSGNNDDALWDSFLMLIQESGRINSSDPRYNIGTFCQVDGTSGTRLLLREDAVRPALMTRLAIHESATMGDGRHELSIRLLRLLDRKGYLVKKIRDQEFPTDSAFWEVAFHGVKNGQMKRITGWPFVIIIDPSISPYIAKLNTYNWTAHIERGSLGAARAVRKPGAADAADATPDGQAAPQASAPGAGAAGNQAASAATAAPLPAPTPAAVVTPIQRKTKQHEQAQRAAAALSAFDLAAADIERRAQELQAQASAAAQAPAQASVVEPRAAPTAASVEAPQASAPAAAAAPMMVEPPAAPAVPSVEAPQVSAPADAAAPVVDPPAASTKPKKTRPTPIPASSFITSAEAQYQQHRPRKANPPVATPAVTVQMLTQACLQVLDATTPPVVMTGATRGNREVYVISRALLELHAPERDWAELSPSIIELCERRELGDIEAMPGSGQLHIVIPVATLNAHLAQRAQHAQDDESLPL